MDEKNVNYFYLFFFSIKKNIHNDKNCRYKNGILLKSCKQNLHENILVEDTAKHLLDIYEKNGIESIEDWQVDELLEWTNTLSFKEYYILKKF